jgi:hypothetical protein
VDSHQHPVPRKCFRSLMFLGGLLSPSTHSISSTLSYRSLHNTHYLRLHVFTSCSRTNNTRELEKVLVRERRKNVTLHVRLSCSAHRLEHRWSKVMQDHFWHVMPSTILKDWRITSLWRESAAMGVQGVFWIGAGIGLYWRKRRGRLNMVIPE